MLSPEDFLSALASERYGKLVCLNLFRACRLGLLQATDVRAYIEDCATELNSWTYAATEASEAVVRASRSWQARQACSRRTRRTVNKTDVDATGVSTVAHLWSVVRDNLGDANAVYHDRRKPDANDFREFIDGLVSRNRVWRIGLDRDYCWMASCLDVSMCIANRQGTMAQLHRDVLGLGHLGTPDVLVRLAVGNRGLETVQRYYRPMAFDGLDNAAFRATRDTESPASVEAHGTTVALDKVQARATDVDGTREWLCEPTDMRAGDIVWEYLGTPADAAIQNLPKFHEEMFVVLGGQVLFDEALPALRAALGGAHV